MNLEKYKAEYQTYETELKKDYEESTLIDKNGKNIQDWDDFFYSDCYTGKVKLSKKTVIEEYDNGTVFTCSKSGEEEQNVTGLLNSKVNEIYLSILKEWSKENVVKESFVIDFVYNNNQFKYFFLDELIEDLSNKNSSLNQFLKKIKKNYKIIME